MNGRLIPVALAMAFLTFAGFSPFASLPLSAQVQTAWVARYHGPGLNADTAYDLKVDQAGNVYVTGGSSSTTNYDFATIKYSPDGQQVWVRRYDGGGFYDVA